MKRRSARGLLLLSIGVLVVSSIRPAATAQDQPVDVGPDVIVLNELENEYEPVPFDHRSHALMAQMWNGCVTCHHYSPNPDQPTTGTVVLAESGMHSQEESVRFPDCKSCHAVAAEEADIRMPGLKGAYHRQCLACHREWMNENACVICHLPKENGHITPSPPTPGDIVGRMHPPIPEPAEVAYQTRFTPADGANVLFRHEAHIAVFGINCVTCHRQDNCVHCHQPGGEIGAQKPLRPSLHWNDAHAPCMSCHQQDRCQHCHYRDDQLAPPPFDHLATGVDCHSNMGVALSGLDCGQCHTNTSVGAMLTCGGAECHSGNRIDYPAQLPGPLATPIAAGGS